MPYPRHIPPHEVVRHFGLIKDNVLFIITLSKVNRTLLFLDTSSFYIRNNMNEPIGLPCFWRATDNSPVAISIDCSERTTTPPESFYNWNK